MATGVFILFGLTFYIVCISSSYMPNKVQGTNGEEVEAIGKRQDTIEPSAVSKRALSDEALDTLELNAVAKRAGSLVIEVSFLFDKKALQKYVDREEASSTDGARALAKTDLDYMISEMNTMYASLNLGLTIGRRNVVFLNSNLHKGKGNKVTAKTSLNSFRKFLKSENTQKNLNWDLAILLTGYDLTAGGSSGVAGYADVAAVCMANKRSYSASTGSGVVEFSGIYSDILTAAHEIGHIMGCQHDSPANGNIMSPITSLQSLNRWSFSSQSRQNMTKHMENLDEWKINCLTTTSAQTVIPKDISVPKLLSTPDGVCKRTRGKKSFHSCKGSGGDEWCKRVWCNAGGLRCTSAFPSESMTCGDGKVCDKGICKNTDKNKPSPNRKVNGGWGAWKWGQCSKSCGGGQKTASRACNNPAPSNEGRHCSGSTTKSASCNTQSCNKDNGCKDKNIKCENLKGYCDSNNKESKDWMKSNCIGTCKFCNKNRDVDGGWGAWSDVKCSKSCGGGTMMSIRYCNNPSPSGKGSSDCWGRGGDFATTLQTETRGKSSCNTQSCPVSSVNGNWGAWSVGPCSKSCGGGAKMRSRSCNNPSPTKGGLDCYNSRVYYTTIQTKYVHSPCNTQSCGGTCKDGWSGCYANRNKCKSPGWKNHMTNACKNTCNLC